MNTIILADDHRLIRAGLKAMLQKDPSLELVGEAADGLEAIELVRDLHPDLIILDISMPALDGLSCIEHIRSASPQTRILLLTMHEDEQYIRLGFRLGAQGFLTKNAVDKEFFDAVRAVLSGSRYLSPQDSQRLLRTLGEETAAADRPEDLLSTRELEVLRYIVHGYAITEIAPKLTLSAKTVETYKTRVMEKIGATRKSELVNYALKHSLMGTLQER